MSAADKRSENLRAKDDVLKPESVVSAVQHVCVSMYAIITRLWQVQGRLRDFPHDVSMCVQARASSRSNSGHDSH
jgi:hypothetical protein